METENNIAELLGKYPREQRFSLAVLQEIQKNYKYISADNLSAAAEYLGIPVSGLFSMATFYKSLSLEKKGKLIVKVCDGTACHIRGSVSVLEEMERALGIKAGETTKDGLFSLEIVNCVGSCAMAPVVICDDEYYGNVQRGKGAEIIENRREREAG